jgi:hypothetical protein
LFNFLVREAYFHQKDFQKNFFLSESGSGSGRFRKSDPVKNHPDPQHCCEVSLLYCKVYMSLEPHMKSHLT